MTNCFFNSLSNWNFPIPNYALCYPALKSIFSQIFRLLLRLSGPRIGILKEQPHPHFKFQFIALFVQRMSFRVERSGIEKSVLFQWVLRISPLAFGSVEMTVKVR